MGSAIYLRGRYLKIEDRLGGGLDNQGEGRMEIENVISG